MSKLAFQPGLKLQRRLQRISHQCVIQLRLKKNDHGAPVRISMYGFQTFAAVMLLTNASTDQNGECFWYKTQHSWEGKISFLSFGFRCSEQANPPALRKFGQLSPSVL